MQSQQQNLDVFQSLHNPRNILITADDILNILLRGSLDSFLKDHDVDINKWNLTNFQKAMTHISYSENRSKKQTKNVKDREDPDVDPTMCVQIQKESMERLEWLGDAVLQSVVASYLWKRFPRQDEGFYTGTRSKLVRTEAFGKFGEYLGLDRFILVSHYVEDYNNGRYNVKNLEDCFEAFIGALYLETETRFGYSLISKFVINIIEKIIDFPMLILVNHNYKDQLMRYCQRKFDGAVPTYHDINVEEYCEQVDGGVIKKRTYTVEVRDGNGKQLAVGISAKGKKEAQQNSAMDALKQFGLPIHDRINPFLV